MAVFMEDINEDRNVFWNRRTAALDPYVPGEQPRDRAFIKLNTNENPYPPSPKVIEAIERVLAEGGDPLRLYPDPLCTEFREAAAAAYGVRPGEVFPGNGSDEALAFAFGAFFESAEDISGGNMSGGCGTSGDTSAGCGAAAAVPPLLFPDVTYSFYPVYANLWGIPYRTIPLTEDFSIDVNQYMNEGGSGGGADSECGGVIIANPNAPTGRALPAKDLLALAAFLEKRRRVLIVDEAYAAFGAESLVPHIKDHPNLLTVHTLSKSASLAGLRAGFAIGGEELVRGLFRIRDSFNSYTMDRLALAGGAAAVLDRAYYDGINRRIIATRERSAAALRALGFGVIPSGANFLFIRPPRSGGAELTAALRERGILVRHFKKPRIEDWLRVSIGTDSDMDAFLAACRETGG